MQGVRTPSLQRQLSDNIETNDSSSRNTGDRTTLGPRSDFQREQSGYQEALMKAQILELKQDLLQAQQAKQVAQHDLQRRESLIRSAAGEARKEVMSLRTENHDIKEQLAAARQKIQALEEEIAELRDKLAEASGEGGGAVEELRQQLRKADLELEELRSADRIHKAAKTAIEMQVDSLIAEVSKLKKELVNLQQAQSAKVSDADDSSTQAEFDLLKKDYEQAMTRLEILQNELDVTIHESCQDRMSAAAKILELQTGGLSSASASPGQENCSRRESPGASQSNWSSSGLVQGLKTLLSPTQAQAKPQQQHSFEKHLLSPSSGDQSTTEGKHDLVSAQRVLFKELQAAGHQDNMAAELRAASSYLQDLGTRLQDSSTDLRELTANGGDQVIHEELAVFKNALEIVEAQLGIKSSPSSSDGSEAVSIEEKTQRSPARPKEAKSASTTTLMLNVVGGLVLGPILLAAAVFLPARNRPR